MVQLLENHKYDLIDALLEEQEFKIGTNSGDPHVAAMQQMMSEFRDKMATSAGQIRDMLRENQGEMDKVQES